MWEVLFHEVTSELHRAAFQTNTRSSDQKLFAAYKAGECIVVFTRAWHSPYVEPVESSLFLRNPVSTSDSALILSPNRSLSLSHLETKCILCCTSHTSHSPWFGLPVCSWWRIWIVRIVDLSFVRLHCYILSLKPTYRFQYDGEILDLVFWTPCCLVDSLEMEVARFSVT